MILGTLHYLSPEQLNGGKTDARSDIFAFGAVLHEMLTARRAFDGATQAVVIAAILERDPLPDLGHAAHSACCAGPRSQEGARQGSRRALAGCGRSQGRTEVDRRGRVERGRHGQR